MRKSLVIGCVVSLVSLGFFLLFAELTLRVLGIGYGNSPLVPDPVVHHTHPASYTFRFHMLSDESGGHNIHYDENGVRVSVNTASVDCTPDGPFKSRVAFMGDSFVEANQVEYEESFIGLLNEKAQEDVCLMNFGVSSYSPVLYYLQWKKLVKKYRPTHVVLMLYSNDFRDDAEYLEDAIYSKDKRLLAIPGPELSTFVKLGRMSYLARLIRKAQLQWEWVEEQDEKNQQGAVTEEGAVGGFLEENPELSLPSLEYLQQLFLEMKQDGVQVYLTAVPSRYELRGGKFTLRLQFSKRLQGWAEKEANISFIDLVEPFRSKWSSENKLFFDSDIHFNHSGHHVVAHELSAHLTDQFKTPAS